MPHPAACPRARLVLLALLAAAASCRPGPDFVRPTPPTPRDWSEATRGSHTTAPETGNGSAGTEPAPQAVVSSGAPIARWWHEFNDPTLTSLIERASSDGIDARVALLRIEEARAQRAVTAAGLWPQLGANASYTRQRFSTTTATGNLFSSVGKNLHLPPGAAIAVPNPYEQLQLGASAAWELDVFGRVRRSLEASDAMLAVSRADARATLLALAADVARSYLELRGAQARRAVALANLSTATDLYELTRQRRSAGLATQLDEDHAAAQLAMTRAQLPLIEAQITTGINQLSRLLALPPQTLAAELTSSNPVPPLPALVPIGIPADLARRRPDILAAEAHLHAATAQVGVAIADLFPRLTFSAAGGWQSQTAGQLTEWASRFGSLGPSLEVPVFDRGRWVSVRLQELRTQEAALAYERTVLVALSEVEDAVAAFRADHERRAWLETTVAKSADALGLVRLRYENGVASFIEVLDAARALESNQLSLADAETSLATDRVQLYRALGGDSGGNP